MIDPKQPPEKIIEVNPGELDKEEVNLNPEPKPEGPPTQVEKMNGKILAHYTD